MKLGPYALGTLDELLTHLELTGASREGDLDRGVLAGNAATDWLERHTARALRVRTHRNTQTFSGTWTKATAGAQTISGSALDTKVKAHDDIVGVGLEPGTRVVSVDSASQITVSEIATANGTGVTLTVGSRPLVLDGSGASDIYVSEHPLQQVYGAKYRDGAGNLYDLTITSAYIADRENGLYRLVNDAFPRGTYNIEIECLAGYVPPSATDRGDRVGWGALNRLWPRVAEVFYQEKRRHAGRISGEALGQSSVTWNPDMPADVYRDAEPFVRRS